MTEPPWVAQRPIIRRVWSSGRRIQRATTSPASTRACARRAGPWGRACRRGRGSRRSAQRRRPPGDSGSAGSARPRCARLALLHGQARDHRVGDFPAARTIVSAAMLPGQVDLARLDGPHRMLRRSTPADGQHRRDPRQHRVDHPVSGLDPDEADFIAIHVLVEGGDAVHEGGQLAEQLHPDQPAAMATNVGCLTLCVAAAAPRRRARTAR